VIGDRRVILRGHSQRTAAFTLVELVMVVVIISIIAAIAVPRVSNAAKNAQAEGIRATIANVNQAIDHYHAEHGKFPGYNATNGTPDGGWFVNQLTQYSDAQGNTRATPDSTHVFGPYLQRPFPTNPFNGLNTVSVRAGGTGTIALDSSGWIARLDDGSFTINTDEDLLPIEVFGAKEISKVVDMRVGL